MNDVTLQEQPPAPTPAPLRAVPLVPVKVVDGRSPYAPLATPILPVAARFVRFLARDKISPIAVMETLAS
jgi:hypothetical protein